MHIHIQIHYQYRNIHSYHTYTFIYIHIQLLPPPPPPPTTTHTTGGEGGTGALLYRPITMGWGGGGRYLAMLAHIHMISSVSNHVCTLHMFEKNYVHIPDADCMIDHYINDSFHQLVWFHFLCQDTLDKSCNAPEATAFFASLGLCCTARKMASCGGKLFWSTGWNKHALCVGLIGIW